MLITHKIRLNPNKAQQRFFYRSAGVARFAYNWALDQWKSEYEVGNKPTEAKLRKQLNSIKREDFPWMLDVSKTVPQQAIKNLGSAFKGFFRRVNKGQKPGYPRFKKRGIHDSFRPDDGSTGDGPALQVDGRKIQIPKLGWIKMAEAVRFNGKIISSTISRTADEWFISIVVDTQDLKHVRENQGSCGIDLGINSLAALDNGGKYMPAQALAQFKGRLVRAQQLFARKKTGGANRRKAKIQVARLYYKIGCLRSDVLHKATTDIVLNNSFIAMEDLNVKGMVKNHKLAKAVSDASFGEFKRQIEYKAALYGSTVHTIDRFFPSTKLCMDCGQVHDMPLSQRSFECECGVGPIDRDVHAAQNILRQALAKVKAFGDSVRPGSTPAVVVELGTAL